MKKILLFLMIAASAVSQAQQLGTLTVEKIMRDPRWIGTSPSNIRWSDDSKKVYFSWNPTADVIEHLYVSSTSATKPTLATIDERRHLSTDQGEWNGNHTLKVFEKNGDIFIADVKNGTIKQLTHTTDRESAPRFFSGDSKVTYIKNNNLFLLYLKTGETTQLTNFVAVSKKKDIALTDQERWLKSQQVELFDVIKEKNKQAKSDSIETAEVAPAKLKEIITGDKSVQGLRMSPDGRFITYKLIKKPEGDKLTIVPNFVTSSGFTEDIVNRTKVGAPQPVTETCIFDTRRDTIYCISTKEIPGIKDIPAYLKDYPKLYEESTKLNRDRKVLINGPIWNQAGTQAVVIVYAEDHKDRWIMKLDAPTGKLSLLDRQHDDAWIAGPGIGGSFMESTGNLGWIDNSRIYFQSEASGYSHIYVADVNNGQKKQITAGNWEVQTLKLSNDKKVFYFTANIDHPGITHFYRVSIDGGKPVQLTSMKGGNEVTLSPDEKWLAVRYSYTNKPWELYIQANKPGAKATRVTNSISEEFKSYTWRDPEMITFQNRYGAEVHAHLYRPKNVDPAKPAVVFVHGAGYLQNVTYSWSYYFREYMFNNLLADNGYTVLDIDYTASAGYGRDWRTGISRHMGGKDLTDQVDGVKLLVDKYGVNPKHVGIYGGSYGGFITLMALFTQPDVFACGAGLRSVTDWAHYNHEYTSNILNEPFTDEKAYRQSSPIYFAEGLKGRLLMCHGMIDQNVNFQDIVRLSQRLIELHKNNWELAPYPVEDHGFIQPSSWTDEYKRIFKLFEETLKK